jgi:uncharacterized membrane protein
MLVTVTYEAQQHIKTAHQCMATVVTNMCQNGTLYTLCLTCFILYCDFQVHNSNIKLLVLVFPLPTFYLFKADPSHMETPNVFP